MSSRAPAQPHEQRKIDKLLLKLAKMKQSKSAPKTESSPDATDNK